MESMEYSGPIQIITVGVRPGEMFLETIKEVIKKHDIKNGAVVSGIGTLTTCQMHYIEHTNFPPKDVFYTIKKPMELAAVSGIIADYEPHLHIVVASGEKESHAGHLEPNSETTYLGELVILKFNELKMTRTFDKKRGIKLLNPQK